MDRYEVLDVVGSGGMATVWRARDTRLDRIVALKRPHPAPAGSEILARFGREARVAATVAHPHLVAVHDAGEDADGPFLVMEYVDAPSLAEVPIGAGRVDAIGAEIAGALAALHAAGICHGDVTPGNILVGPFGAKLTDFGIARPVRGDATVTRPGIALGTPGYVAPEVAGGGPRSPAADVYSLGAVLYEVATGERWHAPSGATRAVPTDPGLAEILRAALASDPGVRPSAAGLARRFSERRTGGGGGTVAATIPIAAPPTSASYPGDVEPPPASDGSTTRHAALVFGIGAAAVLAVLVAVVAARDRGDTSSAATTVPQIASEAVVPTSSQPVAATAPAASAPATTATETTSPPSSPSTTAPPASPATTATPSPSAEAAAIASSIASTLDELQPKPLKPKEARDIVDAVDRAVAAAGAGDPAEAEARLTDAAGRVERSLDPGAERDAVHDQLVDLAEAIGVDPRTVTDELG